MEDGRGPGAFAVAVVAGELLESFAGGFGNDDGAVVGEDDELAVGEDEGAAEVRVGPEGFAGFGVETAEEALFLFLVNGAVEAVEGSFEKHGWVDVVLEFLVGPNGFGGVFFEVEEGGAFAPPRGEVELAINHLRVG